jgi:hypothetical protein
MASAALLAHILVSKYADHLPLYRQSEIYARQGVDLERSTMAEWVGRCFHLLDPLTAALARYVLGAQKLHADDTPVPVLEPGRGKTKTGRLWVYVRDDRPAGSKEAPAVLFRYAPDRRGEQPKEHLKDFRGVLQADAYAGFNQLYDDGRIQEAACWAHYLEPGFIRSPQPAMRIGRATSWFGTLWSGEPTPHNLRRRIVPDQRAGEWRCRFRYGRTRVPRVTLRDRSGVWHTCQPARCIHQAAAPSLATEAMLG